MENLEIEPFASKVENNTQTEITEEIIKRYARHTSILKIKERVNAENEKFIFPDTTPNVIKDEINKLDPKKASVENNIPTKILIGSQDIVCDHLSNIHNNSKNDYKYPKTLKLADATPIHKKEDYIKEKLSTSKLNPCSF